MVRFSQLQLPTRMLLGSCVPLVLITILAFTSYMNIQKSKANNLRVLHTQKIINNIKHIEKLIFDMETSERGFIITGQEHFLEPYNQGKAKLAKKIAETKYLVRDNPALVDRLSSIEIQVDEWLDKAASVEINARRQIGDEYSKEDFLRLRKLLTQETGKKIIDNLRKKTIEFTRIEEQLMVERQHKMYQSDTITKWIVILGTIITIIISLFISATITKLIMSDLKKLVKIADEISNDNYEVKVPIKNKHDFLAIAFDKMLFALRVNKEKLGEEKAKLEYQNYTKNQMATITGELQKSSDLKEFAKELLAILVPLVNGAIGLFYCDTKNLQQTNFSTPQNAHEETHNYSLIESYAYSDKCETYDNFKLGEGLVGQCALENKIMIAHSIENQIVDTVTGSGRIHSRSAILVPVEIDEQVLAVIEIASTSHLGNREKGLLSNAASNIAIIMKNIIAKDNATSMLDKYQSLTKELQNQQTALKRYNTELQDKQKVLAKQSLALEEQASSLALSNKYKSDFLANMSHELRTPLNSIMVLSEVLSENPEGNLDDDQVQSVQMIHRSGSDLLSLINDILDLAKVESGKIAIKTENVNVEDIVQLVQGTFSHMMEKKGLDFAIQVADNTAQTITTAQLRLEQILKNFISNAYKFTEKGSVSVNFSQKVINNENMLAIAVTDTGVGIAKEQQEFVFEEFQQVENSLSKAYDGTGLGLSVARGLATLLGGHIELDSELGKGSTFSLFIPEVFRQLSPNDDNESLLDNTEPNRQVTQVENNNSEEPAIKSELSDRIILLVDDDNRNIFSLKAALKKTDIVIITANSGQQAIDKLTTHPEIEVVLMDIMMPGMDGIEATQQIRTHDEWATLPIIAVTANAMKGDREKYLQQGLSDYLPKPVHIPALLGMLKKWLP